MTIPSPHFIAATPQPDSRDIELQLEVEKLQKRVEEGIRENYRLSHALNMPVTNLSSANQQPWSDGWKKIAETYEASIRNIKKDLTHLDEEYSNIQKEIELTTTEISYIQSQKESLLEVSEILKNEVVNNLH